MEFVFSILFWLLAPVGEANVWAADVVGGDAVSSSSTMAASCDDPLWRQHRACPDRLRWSLTVIADRESPGNLADAKRWQGVHPTDGWASKSIERNATARGWLQSWCPFHQADDDISTVGNYGLMFGYNAHRIPELGPCWPSWLMSFPRISALASARRFVDVCLGDNPDGWCPHLIPEMQARHRRQQRASAAAARARRARCLDERGAARCRMAPK